MSHPNLIVELTASGLTDHEICSELGLDLDTILTIVNKDPKFKDKYKLAQVTRIAKLEKLIREEIKKDKPNKTRIDYWQSQIKYFKGYNQNRIQKFEECDTLQKKMDHVINAMNRGVITGEDALYLHKMLREYDESINFNKLKEFIHDMDKLRSSENDKKSF